MGAMFRVRKSLFGKCILQKFDGDIMKGPPPGFRDVPWRPNIGAFTLVPMEDWTKAQERIALAEKRAKQSRDQRKKKKDFEASQLHDPGSS